jgi:hypothetical protein
VDYNEKVFYLWHRFANQAKEEEVTEKGDEINFAN